MARVQFALTHSSVPFPLWLERWVITGPRVHRIHHAFAEAHFNRNFSILVLWDRLFGTFQPELHRPTYGLTKPVGTYNIIRLQFHEYAAILRDLRQTRSWAHRLGYIFGPPGWQPKAADAGDRVTPADDEPLAARDALERTLPAKLAPPRSPEGTCVVLIVDKSSSMEGRKIELARLASIGVVENLRPIDSVGVLIFDNSFQWAVPIRRAEDRSLIKRLVSGITPDGGTQIAPALARSVRSVGHEVTVRPRTTSASIIVQRP